MEHYKFFQNRECEYFPCHKMEDDSRFNCLFCYCPLYALGNRCGGSFCYTKKGIKNCSNCVRPHLPENYDDIIGKFKELCIVINAVEENYHAAEH